MAYNLRNINVLDLRPSTGVGVALPFSAATAFATVYTTKEQLKYNIINYLLTNKGERLFYPTFGANIRAMLFEQITDKSNEALQINIQSSIEKYFPAVKIVDLAVIPDPDRSTILVQISYRIANTNEVDNILINIQNG